MGVERGGWAPLSNCSATIVISCATFPIENKSGLFNDEIFKSPVVGILSREDHSEFTSGDQGLGKAADGTE
jgi:hypothetical protein